MRLGSPSKLSGCDQMSTEPRQPVGRIFIPDAYQKQPNYDTPVAPLGLGEIGLPMCYTHIAPLGLKYTCRTAPIRLGFKVTRVWGLQ